ncbi:hypothetical protein IKF15_01370 [Candidatus Saccharibacteria bacterium]|nr:hypothetical protein [Candidatus Saccharibacteria bacterium]
MRCLHGEFDFLKRKSAKRTPLQSKIPKTIFAVLVFVFIGSLGFLFASNFDSSAKATVATNANLEPDFRSLGHLPFSSLYDNTPENERLIKQYPRLKKLGDTYILFWHAGNYPSSPSVTGIYPNSNGTVIQYSTSKDLKTWTTPEIIWESFAYHAPSLVQENAVGRDFRVFQNCDALPLKDGSLLVYAAYRSFHHLSTHVELNGLVAKRARLNESTGKLIFDSGEIIPSINPDGTPTGHSFDIGQTIYHDNTTPWEPHAILNGDEIVMAFSNGINNNRASVKDANGNELVKHNTGAVGVIVSSDNGKTWTQGSALAYHYTGTLFSETANSDVNYYTAQMPVATKLIDGRILYAFEMWSLTDNYQLPSGYSISTSTYSQNYDFKNASGISLADLRENSLRENPAINDPRNRANYSGDSQAFSQFSAPGAAPYVQQFPSGEVVVSYNTQGKFYAGIIGDPQSSHQLVLEGGSWGSIELDDADDLLAVYPDSSSSTNSSSPRSINYRKVHLNHSYTVDVCAPVVDGSPSDWSNVQQSLFVGSKSQAQAHLKTCVDHEKVYFLIEHYDQDFTNGDQVRIELQDANKTHTITSTKNSITSNTLSLTKSINQNSDGVVITELSVPRASFDNDQISLYLQLTNQDQSEAVINDSWENIDENQTKSWPVLSLPDVAPVDDTTNPNNPVNPGEITNPDDADPNTPADPADQDLTSSSSSTDSPETQNPAPAQQNPEATVDNPKTIAASPFGPIFTALFSSPCIILGYKLIKRRR